MRYMMSLCFISWLAASFIGAQAQEEEWREELYLRYDAAGWPGKTGPVVSGVLQEQLAFEKKIPELDHVRWLDAAGEKVLVRQFRMPEHSLILEVAVARTGKTAHQVLFDHLARPRTVPPMDAPALPYGEVRERRVGDVCFAHLGRDRKDHFSVEFARYNVVVLLRTEGDASKRMMSLAESIDRVILAQTTYSDWKLSRQWPVIERFVIPSTRVKAGSLLPVDVKISDRSKTPLTTHWEMSAGGIVEEEGKLLFYAEGKGRQTLTLMKADPRGLASRARIEFKVEG